MTYLLLSFFLVAMAGWVGRLGAAECRWDRDAPKSARHSIRGSICFLCMRTYASVHPGGAAMHSRMCACAPTRCCACRLMSGLTLGLMSLDQVDIEVGAAGACVLGRHRILPVPCDPLCDPPCNLAPLPCWHGS